MLKPVNQVEDFIVILRCEYCRGQDQRDALAELAKRGLPLTEAQAKRGELTLFKMARGVAHLDYDLKILA